MSNIVAIVGRPNVGKSTLFNRLTRTREAIVNEESGVTRDRLYGTVEWDGYNFTLIDTGGLVPKTADIFEQEIKKQVQAAIDEADLIYFMVDVTTGITDLDWAVAEMLRKISKPVIVIVNKVDNSKRVYDAYEFYSLGLGEDLFMVSAVNGTGTGDLLDKTVEYLKKIKPSKKDEIPDLDLPKFAIVGRPNVGKSSLLNALLGEERNIVTDIPGTTRDSIHTHYTKFNKNIILIDTAGLRRKSREKAAVEFYSTVRTIRAIEQADVCLLLIDATEGITAQDMHIFRLIQKNHKGIVLVVNKWDLVPKDTYTYDDYKNSILKKTSPFTDIPIVFTSAMTKQRILKALEIAEQVYQNRKQRIKTHELNEYLLPIIEETPPPMYRHRPIKIKYVTQLPLEYPAFAFFANYPDKIKENYKRFLENKLREKYNFTGVPIELFFRKK